MRKTYNDYITEDDSDGCPDCGSDDGHWLQGTYYEPGEWSCNECGSNINSMFDDSRYDEAKDNRAEVL